MLLSKRPPNHVQSDFWRGKSVFVTGHTGFKGGWLSLWLSALGARVTGFALAPATEPNFFAVTKLELNLRSIIGDVRDENALARALTEAQPDIVLHLAAQPLVRYSYANPVETYATNVMGTVHLLEAVRRYGAAQATLVVTSDKCYDNKEQLWGYREPDAMGGHDPYSNSKGCAELVTHAYGKSYFAPAPDLGGLASGRAGNVIGGGDWSSDRLVPDIVRALALGEAPVLRNPTSLRPWQHVLEPLAGYLMAAERVALGLFPSPAAWNFAPEAASHVTVGEVAETLCRVWSEKAGHPLRPIVRADKNAPHEAHLLALDATKARLELGWVPRWDLEATLTHTARWYQAYYAGEDMAAFSLQQIEDYTGARMASPEHILV